jgi:hypothetical protein
MYILGQSKAMSSDLRTLFLLTSLIEQHCIRAAENGAKSKKVLKLSRSSGCVENGSK